MLAALRRVVGAAAAPRQEPWQRHHVSACHQRRFCSVAVLAQCDCAPCFYAGVSRVLRCSAAFVCSLGHSGIRATSGHIRPRRAVRAFGHHGTMAPWHTLAPWHVFILAGAAEATPRCNAEPQRWALTLSLRSYAGFDAGLHLCAVSARHLCSVAVLTRCDFSAYHRRRLCSVAVFTRCD